MKKNLLWALIPALFMMASCGGSSTSSNDAPKTIENQEIKSFMLGGVYFFNGYGGVDAVTEHLKSEVTAKPEDKAFLSQLEKAYRGLLVFPYQKEQGSDIKRELENMWDIKSKEDFLSTEEHLLKEGHQHSFAICKKAIDENGKDSVNISKIDLKKYDLTKEDLSRLQYVKANYKKFGPQGIKAWDYVRYANNIALGYAASYITREESFELLKKLETAVEADYKDWNTYNQDWLLGRGFWGGDDSEEFVKVVEGLSDTSNVYNIYKYIAI